MEGNGGGNTKCLLLVLSGLPASGKTSLTKILQEQLAGNDKDGCHSSCLSHCNVYPISYDELMPAELEKHLIEKGCSETELPGDCGEAFVRVDFACYYSGTVRCVSRSCR